MASVFAASQRGVRFSSQNEQIGISSSPIIQNQEDDSNITTVDQIKDGFSSTYAPIPSSKPSKKIKRDVYCPQLEIIKLMHSYAKRREMPSPETLIRIARLQQCERVNELHANTLIQHMTALSATGDSHYREKSRYARELDNESVISTGPRGAAFKIDGSKKRRYVNEEQKHKHKRHRHHRRHHKSENSSDNSEEDSEIVVEVSD